MKTRGRGKDGANKCRWSSSQDFMPAHCGSCRCLRFIPGGASCGYAAGRGPRFCGLVNADHVCSGWAGRKWKATTICGMTGVPSREMPGAMCSATIVSPKRGVWGIRKLFLREGPIQDSLFISGPSARRRLDSLANRFYVSDVFDHRDRLCPRGCKRFNVWSGCCAGQDASLWKEGKPSAAAHFSSGCKRHFRPSRLGKNSFADRGRPSYATGECAWSGFGHAGCGDSGGVSDSLGAAGMSGGGLQLGVRG